MLPRLRVDEELDRARVDVPGALADAHRVVVQGLGQVSWEPHRGRHLHHLLVAALHAAVALEEVDDVGAVGEDLDLDVPRRVDVPLYEHRAVAEGLLRLVGRLVEERAELLGVAHDAHAAPAAAEGRLADDRVADRLAELGGLRHRGDGMLGAGHDGHVVLDCELARLGLVSEAVDHLGGRPDEDDARLLAELHEAGVLGEEAVARVDRVDALLLRQLDDLLRRQVCSDRALAGANLERLVGLVAVQAAQVFLGIDGDGLDVHLRRGAADTDRDLATVCRENLPDRPPAGADRWRRLKDECRHSPG
mmetsp:Transcript_15980/g.37868  ORF Transcript_15980/g.37868 Transcript_15980/m.37868 type:complete len:306 (-) Transcript_15980:82-999(-)